MKKTAYFFMLYIVLSMEQNAICDPVILPGKSIPYPFVFLPEKEVAAGGSVDVVFAAGFGSQEGVPARSWVEQGVRDEK